MNTTQTPDVTVLAAIDRAERHRGRSLIPISLIRVHLGLPKRSRGMLAQLHTLVEAGSIEQARAYGIDLWTLTRTGRTRLRQAGEVQLPESPQHQAWRDAHTLAAREIERVRESLRETITQAGALLDTTVTSDTWFELAERLQRTAWRLGSVTYCLHEWAEPDDDQTDIDGRPCDPADKHLDPAERRRRESRRDGRRNTHQWHDRDAR